MPRLPTIERQGNRVMTLRLNLVYIVRSYLKIEKEEKEEDEEKEDEEEKIPFIFQIILI